MILKELREKLGLTQQQLATRLGCHLGTVQALEGGKTKAPSPLLQKAINRLIKTIPKEVEK